MTGEGGEQGIPSPIPAHSAFISTRRRRVAQIPALSRLQPSHPGLPRSAAQPEESGWQARPSLSPSPSVGFSQLRRLGQGLGCEERRRPQRGAHKSPGLWWDAELGTEAGAEVSRGGRPARARAGRQRWGLSPGWGGRAGSDGH